MEPPNYRDGTTVNLMRTVIEALGGPDATRALIGSSTLYQPLSILPVDELRARPRRVAIVVIDGLGYHYLLEHRPQGALASHLRGPISSVFPSTTASAISTFLTGEAPQQHAVTGWFMWLRELGIVTACLPFRPRSAAVDLRDAGVDPKCVFRATPIFDRLAMPTYIIQAEYLLDTAFTNAHRGRAELRGFTSLSSFFERLEETLAPGDDEAYVYAYWSELDRLGHAFGMGSPEAIGHLEELDLAFGRFCERMRGSGATLLVTADHGFVDTTPETRIHLDDHPELADMLALPLCGEPRLAYCYVHPELEKDFEAYVLERLAHQCALVRGADLLASGCYGLGEPDPRLAHRVGHHVLVMRDSFVIKDRMAGEDPGHRHVGAHGGVSTAEMTVPLAVISC